MSPLGLAWAAFFLCVGYVWRPGPRRRPQVHRRRWPRPDGAELRQALDRFAAVPGGWLRRVARRPADVVADARLGRSLLVGLPVAAIDPVLGLGAAGGVWLLGIAAAHRRRAEFDNTVRRELPDAIDLLRLAVTAGLTVPAAVETIAAHARGPVAEALGDAATEAHSGARLADALERVPERLGDAVRALVRALVASERYGVPLLPALDRLATDARHDRRQRVEAAARRVPVKLLFPLVTCVLPAFALLTVVPALAGTLQSLRP